MVLEVFIVEQNCVTIGDEHEITVRKMVSHIRMAQQHMNQRLYRNCLDDRRWMGFLCEVLFDHLQRHHGVSSFSFATAVSIC